MSFAPPAPLIVPAVRLLGSVELAPAVEPDAVEPDAVPEALAPAPDELELELALPIFAFFSTKPPPAPAVLDGLAVLLELLSRWRQPVAVTCPAMSLDRVLGWLLEVLGVGWLLGGVAGWLLGGVLGGLLGGVDGGVWAANVPHNAMLLHSVAAHCQ